jgi:hypothetical protein
MMSWTPFTRGTTGIMIIPGATRHNDGVLLIPDRTANPPTTPLAGAPAKGMKKRLNP